MKATLRNYRQSPRKVRLVANLIRGKKAKAALDMLSFLPKKASAPMKKLLESAIANAKDSPGRQDKNLFVDRINVDEGYTFKRYRARARGRGVIVRKRTSRVAIELGERGDGRGIGASISKKAEGETEIGAMVNAGKGRKSSAEERSPST